MDLINILQEIIILGNKKTKEEFSGITGWAKKKLFNTMAPVLINIEVEDSKSYCIIVEKDGIVKLLNSKKINSDCSFAGSNDNLYKLFKIRTKKILSQLEKESLIKLSFSNSKGKEAIEYLRTLFE